MEDNAIVYDGGLFLADTFSVPVGNAFDYLQFKYPFKIDFAITIFCESGTMKVRMNLAEYEVGAGSCFISAPGSICEFLDVSADCRHRYGRFVFSSRPYLGAHFLFAEGDK